MLGKLMKYEWRYLFRKFLILLFVLIAATLAGSLILLLINKQSVAANEDLAVLIFVFSGLVYYMGLIICGVGSSLLIAIRFYKSCYTDAGYLTHTLPVSARQLVGAKLLSSFFLQLLSMVCTLASFAIYAGVLMTTLLRFINEPLTYDLSTVLTEFEDGMGMSLPAYCVFFIVLSLIGCFTSSCIILGSVSLGQLYTKHRVLGAILAYFVVTMLMQMVSSICAIPSYLQMLSASLNNPKTPLMTIMLPTFIITITIGIILAVTLYFVNIHIMTKKLNLE